MGNNKYRGLRLAALDTIASTQNPENQTMCERTTRVVSKAPMGVASLDASGRNLPRIVVMARQGTDSS